MQRLEVSGAGVKPLTGLFCGEKWGAAESFCQNSLLHYCGLQEGMSEAAETGNKPGGPRDLHVSGHVDHISYRTRRQTGSDTLNCIVSGLFRSVCRCTAMAIASSWPRHELTNFKTSSPNLHVAFPDFSSSKTRAAAISSTKRVKQGRTVQEAE